MSLYGNEINGQLSRAKYRALKQEADAERALKAAADGHADRKHALLVWVARRVAAIGGRLKGRPMPSIGGTLRRRTVDRSSERRQFPAS